MVLDFISPENVTECVQLTDEIHRLPEDHKAKVDKLEVSTLRSITSLLVYPILFALQLRLTING